MGRLIWAQLRHRRGRTVALLVGILVATTAFTVLTSAARTSQLRTTGAVSAHFATAYEVLVRPKGTRTALERSTATVQPNFLSGIYGGISLGQYHQIQKLSGVEVAAPIAMVGYSLRTVPVTVPVPSAATGTGRELYRYTTTWLSAGGSSKLSTPPSFLYVTPNKLVAASDGLKTLEKGRNGVSTPVCDGYGVKAAGPFVPQVQARLWCWSRSNGNRGHGDWQDLTATRPGFAVYWSFPMLLAAIDPVAEDKLDGLSGTVTSGAYLRADAGPSTESDGQFKQRTFPVLVSSQGGVDESAATTVQRLADPTTPKVLNAADVAIQARAAGTTVLSTHTTADQAYRQLLDQLTGTANRDFFQGIDGYWGAGGTHYRRNSDTSLTPLQVNNPPSVWRSRLQASGFVNVPPDNADNQYRALHEHESTNLDFTGDVLPFPAPRAVGVFDPGKITAFDALSAVPLGAYAPTEAMPADAASRAALGGKPLLPSLNLGGYVSQPPQLLTTLAALPALQDSATFGGQLHADAPISVIRVRVAKVHGPDAVSRERVRQVAQQIAVTTGLDVDIVVGSSPAPTTIAIPAGQFGQPALRVTEGWVQKGVAVAIVTAADRKSLVLFALILIVCGLFVANAATAAVRGRRHELAVLASLGWSRPRLFTLVLGELTVIGLTAGALGTLLSIPLASAAHLHPSVPRAALAVPAALLLTIVAGAVPAWLAGRADPIAAMRPPVLAVRRGRRPRGVTGLAAVNLLRMPGRTMVGLLSLAVGVAALTLVSAVTLGFRGTVVGTLLGDAVALQVRDVDYIAVAATVALGVLTVADVLYLNIRERAGELATLQSLGWQESTVRRLVLTEGALIGAVGALLGGTLGCAAAATFANELPARLFLIAALAVLAGTTVTVAASLLPLRQLRRLPTAQLLGEE